MARDASLPVIIRHWWLLPEFWKPRVRGTDGFSKCISEPEQKQSHFRALHESNISARYSGTNKYEGKVVNEFLILHINHSYLCLSRKKCI